MGVEFVGTIGSERLNFSSEIMKCFKKMCLLETKVIINTKKFLLGTFEQSYNNSFISHETTFFFGGRRQLYEIRKGDEYFFPCNFHNVYSLFGIPENRFFQNQTENFPHILQ